MTRSIEKEKESMNALEVSGLSKSFGDFRLQNVSFTLPMGCIFTDIFGPVPEKILLPNSVVSRMLTSCCAVVSSCLCISFDVVYASAFMRTESAFT